MKLNASLVLYPEELYLPWPHGRGKPPVADVDWISGIIRCYRTLKEWESVRDTARSELTEGDWDLVQTMTHELTHVLQMVTTGFCYDISWRLFMVLIKALDEMPELWDLYISRERYSCQVRSILADLDKVGPGGVSPRSIIEGAALFAQKTTHIENWSPAQLAEIMAKEAPSERYAVAYRLADKHLGFDAPQFFPHVCYLALCTQRPEQVYERLLAKWRGASRTDIWGNHQEGLGLLKRDFADIVMGSAVDQITRGKIQPILKGLVEKLSRAIVRGEMSELDVLSGQPLAKAGVDAILVPTLFKPERYGGEIPSVWKKVEEPEPGYIEPVWLTVLAAGGYILYPDPDPVAT